MQHDEIPRCYGTKCDDIPTSQVSWVFPHLAPQLLGKCELCVCVCTILSGYHKRSANGCPKWCRCYYTTIKEWRTVNIVFVFIFPPLNWWQESAAYTYRILPEIWTALFANRPRFFPITKFLTSCVAYWSSLLAHAARISFARAFPFSERRRSGIEIRVGKVFETLATTLGAETFLVSDLLDQRAIPLQRTKGFPSPTKGHLPRIFNLNFFHSFVSLGETNVKERRWQHAVGKTLKELHCAERMNNVFIEGWVSSHFSACDMLFYVFVTF